MKRKLVLFLFMFTLIFPCFSIRTGFAADITEMSDTVPATDIQEKISEAVSIHFGKDFEKLLFPVSIDGKVPERAIKLAKQYWSYLPKNVKRIVRDRGVRIVLTAHNAEYYWDRSGILSFYSKSKREIICESKIHSVERGFLHEIGHSVDHALGWPSNDREWKEIYKKERGNVSGYNRSNNVEFFADMFQLFMMSRYELAARKDMDQFPQAKKYMNRMFIESNNENSQITLGSHRQNKWIAE